MGIVLTLPPPCRSMKLTYHDSGVFEGIPIYRFTAPKTLFANGSVYPPNEGFCPCLESGIQNVSTCRFGKCPVRVPSLPPGRGGRVAPGSYLLPACSPINLWSLHPLMSSGLQIGSQR